MTTTAIEFERKKDWLEYRGDKIGSSDIATIAGVNPYETKYQLWQKKTGRAVEFTGNKYTEMGHRLEPIVAGMAIDNMPGCEIDTAYTGHIIFSKGNCMASPDRVYITHRGAKGILECKTTQKDIDKADIPEAWIAQLAFQMAICEFGHGVIAWLSRGLDFDFEFFEKESMFFDGYSLINQAEQFYKNYIQPDKPPPAETEDDLIAMGARAQKGLSIAADRTHLDNVSALEVLKEAKKEIEEKIKTHEDKIKAHMGEAEKLTYNGRTLATWKEISSKRLDTKAFKKGHPDLAEQYTKESKYRRFIIK